MTIMVTDNMVITSTTEAINVLQCNTDDVTYLDEISNTEHEPAIRNRYDVTKTKANSECSFTHFTTFL